MQSCTSITTGMDRRSAADAILALIKSDCPLDTKTRVALAYALGSMGPDVAPVVLEALSDTRGIVRHCAETALRVLCKSPCEPIPALKEALGHPDENVRLGAALALLRMSRTPSACVEAST